MTAVVGESKRVLTMMWGSTSRKAGNKYDYYITLNNTQSLLMTLPKAPTAYRAYLSTIAFWSGRATPTTTVGTLYIRVEGITTKSSLTQFWDSSALFVIPLTSSQWVDQNGVSKQPIIIAPFDALDLHISVFGDDFKPVTDLLDHTVVLTLEPLYD